MGVSDDALFRDPPSSRKGGTYQENGVRGRRMAPWHKMAPLFWAPVMYSARHVLKGRVAPQTQHKIFIGMTLLALSHAGWVMGQDSTTSAGG